MVPAHIPKFTPKNRQNTTTTTNSTNSANSNSTNSNSMLNELIGYKTINEEETEIFIRVLNVDIGSFPASNKADLKVCIGPRQHYLDFAYTMKKNETNIPYTWKFYSKNNQRSSFVIALFKKRYFGYNSEIGKVELNLSSFEPNAVTTREFTLIPSNGNNNNEYSPRIRLSIHVNKNGSPAFKAPQSEMMN